MRQCKRILLASVIVSLSIVNQVFACGAAPTTIGSYYSGTRQPGATIVFTGALSHDNDVNEGIHKPHWRWDFDYHAPSFQTDVNTTSAYPSWTYNQAGVYTVAVRYFDNEAVAGNLYTFQITINGLKRLYYLKDHLGTIRATVDAFGAAVSADDYDPWGMQLEGRSINLADANPKYKFTGKERDVETGLDYFGARYYDSRIARWLSVDPLEEKYASWSPYHYSANNPIRIYDPDGKGWGDVALGAVNAIVSNATPAKRQNPAYYEDTQEEKHDFAVGQLVGDFVSTVQGATEIVAGGGAVGAGGTVELASLGAATPIAIPVAGVGVTAIAHGSTVLVNAGVGALSTGNYLMSESASGQTASGHPTDQHGNKLGPSGKAQVNKVEHSSMKGAKDAARQQGKKTPLKHPSPSKGTRHFHATDENGEKLPNSTHHEY